MTTRWAAIKARIHRLSQRERSIVLVAVLVGLGMGVLDLGVTPRLARLNAARQRLEESTAQRAFLRARATELTAKLSADPNAALLGRVQERKRALALVSERFDRMQKGLVSAQDMPLLLQALVDGEGRVRVSALKNLEPTPLLEPGAGAKEGAALYKHGVEITLQGGYLDVLEYLARLERQPWRVYWARAAMSAEYPRVTLVLTLYTLGLTREWVSV